LRLHVGSCCHVTITSYSPGGVSASLKCVIFAKQSLERAMPLRHATPLRREVERCAEIEGVGDLSKDRGICVPELAAQEEVSETTGVSSWSAPGRKGIQPPNPKARRLAVTHGEGLLRDRWWA
jgi:hypothetical protein